MNRPIIPPAWRLTAAIILPLCACLGFPASAQVVFVDYDDTTSRQHGEFPSRAQLADLTTALHGAGAKAVVLKFFLDGPGREPDNTQLAAAIGRGRTVLQATINREPPTSRELPARFRFAGKPPFDPAIRGDEGWLPLPRFSEKAARVCFVDVRSAEQIPMLEVFGGHPVPSLYACTLAEMFGSDLTLSAGAAAFGTRRFLLNSQGEAAVTLDMRTRSTRLSASRIFAGPGWQQSVRGQVAVLMYTGPRSPTIAFKGNNERVHALFAAQIIALEKVSGKPQPARQ